MSLRDHQRLAEAYRKEAAKLRERAAFYNQEAQKNEALAEEHESHAQVLEDLRQIGAENPGRSSEQRQ